MITDDDDVLKIWTIYQNPADCPGKFVVRRFVIGRGLADPDREPVAVVDTLAQARAAVPPGLDRQPRDPDDDPVIVECWF